MMPANRETRLIASGLMILAVSLALGGMSPALAQQIRIIEMEIIRGEHDFLVKGKVQGSELNPDGQIVEQDHVSIVADIQNGPGAVYPVLPDGMYLSPTPADAKSAYIKGDTTLTLEEVAGHNVSVVRISAFHLRNPTVWRHYGGIPNWVKNAPATVTADFEGRIALEHAGKSYRIRAMLDHRWGGPYAWWSACSLRHDVADEGILGAGSTTKEHQVKITFGPMSSANPAWSGQKIQCIVQAEDSLSHELKYEWKALGGTVGFDDPTLKRPTWTVQPNNTDRVVAWTISVRVYCDHGASAEGHFVQQVQPGLDVTDSLKPIMERYEQLEHGYFEDQSLFGIFPPGASNNIMQAFFDWGKYAPLFWPTFDIMEAEASDLVRFTCGGCQGRVLDMLDNMRLNGTAAEQEAMKHWDYGPLMVLPTMHQVVVIWPKGGSWRTDGTIMDPWPNQRPETIPIGQFMTGQLTNVHVVPSVFYSGLYPLTGGSAYPSAQEASIQLTPRHRRIQELLTQQQFAEFRAMTSKRDKRDYLEHIGAELEKQTPNPLLTTVIATKSPVRILVIDEQRRRVGWVDTETLVNEIPGTEINLFREPDGSQGMLVMMPLTSYRVRATGIAAGSFGLLRAAPEQCTDAALAHAENIAVAPEQWFDYVFTPDTPMRPVEGQDGATYPVVDVLAGGQQTWPTDRQLTPIADADVYAYSYLNWNRANSGKMPTITAGYHPQGGEKRVYLRFELPKLERVQQATLKLYQYHVTGAYGHQLGVYRVLQPWEEGSGVAHQGATEPSAPAGQLSWVSQPAFAPTPEVIFQPGAEPEQWVEVDLTALVNSWLAGAANHGMVLKVAHEPNPTMPNSWYGFRSREWDDSSQRPVLALKVAADGPPVPEHRPDQSPDKPPDGGELPPLLSDPVIKRAAVCGETDDNDMPLLRTSFPAHVMRVGIYLEYRHAPADTQVRIEWSRNGKDVLDSRLVVEGSRNAVMYLRSGKPGEPLLAGQYQARILRNDSPVATLRFTVGH